MNAAPITSLIIAAALASMTIAAAADDVLPQPEAKTIDIFNDTAAASIHRLHLFLAPEISTIGFHVVTVPSRGRVVFTLGVGTSEMEFWEVADGSDIAISIEQPAPIHVQAIDRDNQPIDWRLKLLGGAGPVNLIITSKDNPE